MVQLKGSLCFFFIVANNSYQGGVSITDFSLLMDILGVRKSTDDGPILII